MSEKRYSDEVVYVDPDFEDLMPSFLESREADYAHKRKPREFRHERDQKAGHGMKEAGAG